MVAQAVVTIAIPLRFDCCSTTSAGLTYLLIYLGPQYRDPHTARPINRGLTIDCDNLTMIPENDHANLVTTSCAGGRHNMPPPPAR